MEGEIKAVADIYLGKISHSYDNVGRLITSNQGTNGVSVQRRFAYDRWGNRTGVWDAVTGGNQIQSVALEQSGGAPTNRVASVTTVGTLNYTYDAAGNVTNDGAHSYSYDGENRVVAVDGGAATYGYDHQNRRVKKVVGGVTRHYVWEGSQVISEHNGATGAQIVRYVYAGSRMVAKVEGAATRYFISDRLSARLVLDTSGNVVGKQSHLPYGEEIGGTGEQQKQRFTSYERDSETGTDYAVNRQYNQSTGRFNRPDPLRESAEAGAPQTWNRYSYTINDPINLKDPTGLLLSIAIEYNSCFGVNQFLGPIGGLELGFPVSCGPSVPGPPPEKKVRRFAGFDGDSMRRISQAQTLAHRILFGLERDLIDIDGSCLGNLSANGIDGSAVAQIIAGLRVKPNTADESVVGPYNVLNGAESTIMKEFRESPESDGVPAAIFESGPYIYIFALFHAAGGGTRRQIGPERSRAIILIHEAIHLLGKSDTDFGRDRTTGSHNLSTLIIRSCINKRLTYDDMAIR